MVKTLHSMNRQFSDQEKKFIYTCLVLLTGTALAITLYFAKTVLVPFVVALFLSYVIAPAADFMQIRMRFPRLLAVSAALLVSLAVVTLLGILLVASFQGLADDVGTYQQKLGQLAAEYTAPFETYIGEIDADYVRDRFKQLPLAGILQSTLGNFAAVLSNSFLILVFVVYLITGRHSDRKHSGVFNEIDKKVKKYISLKLLISAATGLLVGISLWLIGLELAVLFGLLAFLLNLIPTIGSVIATLLPVPVAMVQFAALPPILLVVAIPGAIQITIGNFIEPLLLGDSLQLHPITVLLSLVFWGMVWGILGMFIAVPVTAVIKIILEQLEQTAPIAKLMEGKL